MTLRSGNIIKFPGESLDDIEAEAAAWLARVTSGSMTLADLAEFEFWRAASPERMRAYREMEMIWDAALDTGHLQEGLLRSVETGSPRPHKSFKWTIRLGQIAAAILMAIMISQYFSTWRYDYHTAPGEVRRIALADGSTVTMKGGTALNAKVGQTGERVIELARGEAFFEVEHDEARPFTVFVEGGIVRDVGTGFSVAQNGRATRVSVEHGAVEVTAGGRTEMLVPSEQIAFNLYEMGRKLPIDTSVISAWRHGLYIAEGRPLGEVLDGLDEYHAGRIIVISRTLAARRVNAVVQLGHIDAWLDALNQTEGVAVRRWGLLTIVSDRSG